MLIFPQPFVNDYISTLGPGTPPITPPSPPSPKPQKGIPCDIVNINHGSRFHFAQLTVAQVDQLVKNYDIAKANGPKSLGYYGQMVNIACLRSSCSNPACDRVAAERVKEKECEDLPASLPFEEDIFGRIANQASNPDDIKTSSGELRAKYAFGSSSPRTNNN